MKAKMDCGAIPEKESVNIRPMVTAGFAKDVEAVKKYALPIQAGTNIDAFSALVAITKSNPKVATTSPIKVPAEERSWLEISSTLCWNIKFAVIVPEIAPRICAIT